MNYVYSTVVGLLFSLVALNVSAMDEVKDIYIEDAYLALPPPVMKVTAAYFEIQNHGVHDLVLKSVSSSVSERIELHDTAMTGDSMVKMTQLERLMIPAHGSVKLVPGGMHLMVMDLKEELQTGQVVQLTLYFSGQQQISVDAVVRDVRNDKESSMSGGHKHQQ